MTNAPPRLIAEAADAVDLDHFERFIRARHTVRTFKPHTIDPRIIHRLVECARWAPNALNLQPTHFVVVVDEAVRAQLAEAIAQPQAHEAPVLIVLVADPAAAEHHLDLMLADEVAGGNLAADEVAGERQRVRSLFALDRPAWARQFARGPAGDAQAWAERQTAVAGTVLVLAANAAGLAAAPMDRFDAARVHEALGIPHGFIPLLAIGIGQPFETAQATTRLAADRVVHEDRWRKPD